MLSLKHVRSYEVFCFSVPIECFTIICFCISMRMDMRVMGWYDNRLAFCLHDLRLDIIIVLVQSAVKFV